MIDHGENVLQGIRIQNDTIKAIKRKIFNVTNTLGLSNTLIRMIDRRQTSDKYILFGGMIITCLIMVLVIYYFLWNLFLLRNKYSYFVQVVNLASLPELSSQQYILISV